jgi:IS30 family transposase
MSRGTKEQIDRLLAEGLTQRKTAEMVGRSQSTVTSYLFRKKHPNEWILTTEGRPNTCAICRTMLRQETDQNGYRVESCPTGCPCQDETYLEEFRVR